MSSALLQSDDHGIARYLDLDDEEVGSNLILTDISAYKAQGIAPFKRVSSCLVVHTQLLFWPQYSTGKRL